jgi:hypothetical protein
MKEQAQGFLRHVLTFVGGIVIAKGWLDSSSVSELVGALMTIIGTSWSVLSKK